MTEKTTRQKYTQIIETMIQQDNDHKIQQRNKKKQLKTKKKEQKKKNEKKNI